MKFSNKTNFELQLFFEKKEKSKDSHTDKYSLKIIDNNIDYVWEHWGYPDQDSKSKNLTLSDELLDKLITYIKNNELNKNIKENRTTGKMGLAINIDLTIKLNNKSTHIIINGMYNDWTKRHKKKTHNIKNIHYCDLIENIITTIENDLDYF